MRTLRLCIAPAIPWQLTPGPDGDRTIWVRVRASNGAQSPAATTTVVLDTTPPSLSPPTIAPLRGATAGKTDIPVRIGWPASDLSPIATVTLEVSADGGPFVLTSLPTPGALSVVLPLKAGIHYAFRATATDAVGNVGLPVESPTVSFIKTENTSSAIKYSTGWRRVNTTSASGGSLATSSTRLSTATFSFTGSGITIMGPSGPTGGVARVYIDGVLSGLLHAYSSVAGSRQLLYSRQLAAGSHTIKIVPYGPIDRPRIDLDALIVSR